MNPTGLQRTLFVSLRARMTAGFAFAFGLIALAGIVGIISFSYFTARREAREITQDAAALFQREWEDRDSPRRFQRAFQEVTEDGRLAAISLIVVDEKNKVVAANNRPSPEWPAPSWDWLIISVPSERWTIVAGFYWQPVQRGLQRQAALLAALGILVTLTATGLAWLLVGGILQPISALAEQARAAASVGSPLSAELIAPSQDAEIRLLTGTLNEMLDRLREDTRAREQFYAAAAHELRTPLAVLSGSIEVTLARPHRPDEYEETLRDLLHETRRLITLTESILLLNRVEMGTDAEAPESMDLADVCHRLLALLPPAEERNLSLHLCLDETPALCAPPTHIRILLRNLLENAFRYASPGGAVKITTGEMTELPFISVYNDCEMPDTLDLNRLLVPFYRTDASRNTATGGNGLGLTICKALTDANGWNLTLRREQAGIGVRVVFGKDRL